MADPIWNVRVTVIDLVPAPTAEDAISKLSSKLSVAGFDLYLDGDDTQDAFESEPLGDDVEAATRADWSGRWVTTRYGHVWHSAPKPHSPHLI